MYNPHKVLTLVVPTNEPTVCFEYFLAGLENMKAVAPITTIAFNFQNPWDDDLIKIAVDKCEYLGFEVKYSFNSYVIKQKGEVPFNQIRYDAAKLVPDSLFYALTDDDFYYNPGDSDNPFSAGEQYIYCIDYLLRNKNCGLILLTSNKRPGKSNIIYPSDPFGSKYITDGGIILRSMWDEGLIVPAEAISLVGSDEEKIAAGFRLSKGMYPAIVSSKTSHYENHKTGDVQSGALMYNWNTLRVLEENSIKFIKENYNPSYEGRNNYQVINPDLYYSEGGLEIDSEIISEYVTDYNIYRSDSLLKGIIESVVRRG